MPRAILADRGRQFTAIKFQEFVTRTLGARLYFTSVEYPQGNGINESAHRILETAIKTSQGSTSQRIQSIINDATLLHNLTPNRSIGDTPASLIFGTDPHLPGMEEYEAEGSEEARLEVLRNYRSAKLLKQHLKELEESAPVKVPRSQQDFKIGDIVTYRLSTSERKKGSPCNRRA